MQEVGDAGDGVVSRERRPKKDHECKDQVSKEFEEGCRSPRKPRKNDADQEEHYLDGQEGLFQLILEERHSKGREVNLAEI